MNRRPIQPTLSTGCPLLAPFIYRLKLLSAARVFTELYDASHLFIPLRVYYVTALGSCISHQEHLELPEGIKAVLRRQRKDGRCSQLEF